MKRLRLTLLGLKTLIQAARSPAFTCVMRCHKSSLKGKCQNLIISNSVAGEYLPAYWLSNPKLHWLLNPGQLTTTALPKRLYLIFIWQEFSQRDPIPIFNPFLNIAFIIGERWVKQSYLASLKNTETDYFRNGLLSLS